MEMVRTINISGALEKAERQPDSLLSSNALIAQRTQETAQAYTVTPSDESSELNLSTESNNTKGISKVSNEADVDSDQDNRKRITVSREDGVVHVYNRATKSYVPELRIANA